MAQKPIAMEQLKQILQLQKDGIPIREMARRTGISRNSVRKYLALLAASTSENTAISDSQKLAETAYGNDSTVHDAHRLQLLVAHFQYAQGELGKTGVTRQLLWQEYIAQHPDGYVYSHYCYHLNQYLKNRDLSMHLEYQAADMIMIDFAGKKMHYVELSTGEQIECQVFSDPSFQRSYLLPGCSQSADSRLHALHQCHAKVLWRGNCYYPLR